MYIYVTWGLRTDDVNEVGSYGWLATGEAQLLHAERGQHARHAQQLLARQQRRARAQRHALRRHAVLTCHTCTTHPHHTDKLYIYKLYF